MKSLAEIGHWLIVCGFSAILAFGCGGGGATDGSACVEQSDCLHACSYDPAPIGPGTCGPFRLAGQSCTRPNYATSDCAQPLSCLSAGICGTRTSTARSSDAGTGASVCAALACLPNQTCVNWIRTGIACANLCSSNSSCRSGCCATLTSGAHACAPDSSSCGSGS